MKQVIVIGGGISGLIASIVLARKGVECLVIEKKSYPQNRVCGEYISNEATPFLRSIAAFPHQFDPPEMKRLLLSSIRGKAEILPLDLGGFGISRFVFDDFLYRKAKALGVEFWLDTAVKSVDYNGQDFLIQTDRQEVRSEIVLGAFGKRSRLDAYLDRKFMHRRSPYIGVKYHIKTDYPHDLISLHNFPGGYCGISRVENDTVNVCYLSHRDNLRKFKNIEQMESEILWQNPLLRSLLQNSQRLWTKPEVINEISFEAKSPIENHMLMIGDSAGMITPLCGNGMAMAMHAALIASNLSVAYLSKSISRDVMERQYAATWNKVFSNRLWAGRNIQKLFGSPVMSSIAIGLALYSKPLARYIIRNTHGNTF